MSNKILSPVFVQTFAALTVSFSAFSLSCPNAIAGEVRQSNIELTSWHPKQQVPDAVARAIQSNRIDYLPRRERLPAEQKALDEDLFEAIESLDAGVVLKAISLGANVFSAKNAE